MVSMSGLVACISYSKMVVALFSVARWEIISSLALEIPSTFSCSRTSSHPMTVKTACPEKGTCSGGG